MRALLICLIAAAPACVVPRHCQPRLEKSLAILDELNERSLIEADLRPFKRAAKSILRCGDSALYQEMANDTNPFRSWVGQCGLARVARAETVVPVIEAVGNPDSSNYHIDDFNDLVNAFLDELSRKQKIDIPIPPPKDI